MVTLKQASYMKQENGRGPSVKDSSILPLLLLSCVTSNVCLFFLDNAYGLMQEKPCFMVKCAMKGFVVEGG